MENTILQYLIALAPGFLGVAAQKLVRGDMRQEDLQHATFKYFLYTAAAWSITELASLACPYIKGKLFAIFMLVTAAALGAAWPLKLKSCALFAANKLNHIAGLCPTGLEENILDLFTDDTAERYWIIRKHGQTIAAGWLEWSINHEGEFTLLQDPKWKDLLPEKHEVRYIVFKDADFCVEEHVNRVTE